MVNRVSILARLPFFVGMPAEHLAELETSLKSRRYTRGESVFHRDDPGDSLFIIDEGRVRIGLASEDGREITLTLLSAGEYFGELALLDEEPRSADAVVIEPARLLRLDRGSFLGFLEANSEATAFLLAAMSRQIRRLTDQVYDATFLDVQTRLAKAILGLASKGEETADGPSIRITQAELASMVGATRESVNKWLHSYERRGILRLERRSITVLRGSALSTYAVTFSYS